jgi:hypothetical protein
MRSRALSALAIASLTLTPTACDRGSSSGTDSPTASSSPTRSATPSPVSQTPKEAPPSVPTAAITGLTVRSADAFTRFYLAASDYAEATGDATLMRQWAYSTCKSCQVYASTSEQTYRNGGAFTGELGTKVTRIKEVRLIRKDTAAVLVGATVGRTAWRPKAGAAPTPFPGGSVVWDITLAAVNGHWTMFEMELKE